MEFNYFKLYSLLYFKFGLNEFTLDDISRDFERLGVKTPLGILIQRLYSKGYVERVSRGRYRIILPNVILLEALGFKWRDRINRDYRVILEYVVSRIIDYFREKLISVVLYGSLARGTVKEYSDIDLLVIAEDLPCRYSDRVKMISHILDDVSSIRTKLWIEKKIYPLIDIILLSKNEASIHHPFYLDMIYDAIIIYDKDSFMRSKIEELRRKLSEMGSKRIQLPNGRYYWVLKPSIKWGELIEL